MRRTHKTKFEMVIATLPWWRRWLYRLGLPNGVFTVTVIDAKQQPSDLIGYQQPENDA